MVANSHHYWPKSLLWLRTATPCNPCTYPKSSSCPPSLPVDRHERPAGAGTTQDVRGVGELPRVGRFPLPRGIRSFLPLYHRNQVATTSPPSGGKGEKGGKRFVRGGGSGALARLYQVRSRQFPSWISCTAAPAVAGNTPHLSPSRSQSYFVAVSTRNSVKSC